MNIWVMFFDLELEKYYENWFFFSLGNITPLFCTASLCFLVKLCVPSVHRWQCQWGINEKRVHVMGNRATASQIQSTLMRLITYHHMTMHPFFPKPPSCYKGSLHPQSQKKRMKIWRQFKILGKCHLRVRKRETPSRATDYALARASATVG